MLSNTWLKKVTLAPMGTNLAKKKHKMRLTEPSTARPGQYTRSIATHICACPCGKHVSGVSHLYLTLSGKP